MSEAPLFSVISTCRNAGSYARRSIESVLAQTEKSWELWFVDDASDEEWWNHAVHTLDVLCLDSRITLIHNEERKWKLANFLGAFARSRAPIIVELDGDDWFATPDALSTIRRAYESSPLVDATAGSHRGYPNGSIMYPCTQPAPGHRIMQSGFAASVPAPRTWRRALTERSLIETPDIYIDPITGHYWQTNADLALFAPALFWARQIATIDDVLVEANFESPHHDFALPNNQQREEGLRLFEALYQREWQYAASQLRVFDLEQ